MAVMHSAAVGVVYRSPSSIDDENKQFINNDSVIVFVSRRLEDKK